MVILMIRYLSDMKTCTRCSIEKTLDSFQIRKASPDGYTSACKLCLAKYDKKRANLPHRVKARKDYSETIKGRIAGSRAKRKWDKNNPLKKSALKEAGTPMTPRPERAIGEAQRRQGAPRHLVKHERRRVL